MLLEVILFILGLALLIKGANWLVDGAASFALRLKISPIVIGLTIVAFGTSSPELLVSVTSAFSGNTSIALGNVIGSNIINILLILGLTAIIFPLKVNRNTVTKEVPMSFLGAVVVLILGAQDLFDRRHDTALSLTTPETIGSLTFSNGLILLCFFIIFIYYTFGIAKTTKQDDTDVKQLTRWKEGLFIFVGLICLGFGSKLFVDNAVLIARSLGASELLIGLTIVALGTSMPELVTNIVAAMKKKVDFVIGNIVGSNIFNIFFILGTTALIETIPLSGENIADIIVLFLTTLFLFSLLFIYRKYVITRLEGILMVAGYLFYLTFLIVRG